MHSLLYVSVALVAEAGASEAIAELVAAARFRNAELGVTALLPKVTTPTLVVHCRDDAMVPFEAGRAMASAIPGARFVALEGRNHMILADSAAWPRFVSAVRSFLDG